MHRGLVGLTLSGCKISAFNDIRLYATSSKLANAQRGKVCIEKERALLFHEYRQKMRLAILGEHSRDPVANKKLAALIDQAKKSNMPMVSIATFLSNYDPSNCQNSSIVVRGPGNSSLVVQFHGEYTQKFKCDFQSVVKKHGCRTDPTLKHQYQHTGCITAEKDCSLDTATEDAINAGADDVEEIQEDGRKRYLFNCEPLFLDKVTNDLLKSGYTIISAGEEYIPLETVTLTQKHLDIINNLCDKIYQVFCEKVVKINDNIDYSECQEELK